MRIEKRNVCPFCGSTLKVGIRCRCPGAEEERQKRVAAKSAADDMEVHILLHKVAGESGYHHEIRARSGADAVYGTAVLIRDLAKATGRTVEQTLALLATVLLTAGGPERADVGSGPYGERSGADGEG